MVPTLPSPPGTSLTLHATPPVAPVSVAANDCRRPTRTDADDGVTVTVVPFCRAAPESGLMRSTVASTASKFDPSSCPSVCRLSSFQRGSGLPEMNQAEPLSARMMLYFFIARRMTCTSAG
jgi:hypothetical protein